VRSTFHKAEIRDAERALEEALQSTEPTAWVYHYTEDAIFVSSGSQTIQGRKALLEMAADMQPLSSVSLTAVRTEGNENRAYTYGTAIWVSGRPPTTGTTTHVRFVIVWRREEDGRWRVAQEMLDADPTAEPAH
jgi:uncharacterized protein (TIGR02246 family)